MKKIITHSNSSEEDIHAQKVRTVAISNNGIRREYVPAVLRHKTSLEDLCFTNPLMKQAEIIQTSQAPAARLDIAELRNHTTIPDDSVANVANERVE